MYGGEGPWSNTINPLYQPHIVDVASELVMGHEQVITLSTSITIRVKTKNQNSGSG